VTQTTKRHSDPCVIAILQAAECAVISLCLITQDCTTKSIDLKCTLIRQINKNNHRLDTNAFTVQNGTVLPLTPLSLIRIPGLRIPFTYGIDQRVCWHGRYVKVCKRQGHFEV
jgi:hypothetical protein